MDATWYVTIKGKQNGPYSADQLRDLLNQGQIKDGDVAQSSSSPQPGSLHLSVRDILAQHSGRGPSDPADGLFRALQLAKEKKNSAASPDSSSLKEFQRSDEGLPISRSLLIVAGIVLIASSLIWGLSRWIAESNPKSSRQARAEVENEGRPSPRRTGATQGSKGDRRTAVDSQRDREQQIARERERRRIEEKEEDRRLAERERERELEREQQLEQEREKEERDNSAAARQDNRPEERLDPGRAGDWREARGRGYVEDDSLPPDDRPGEEGMISRISRERGIHIESPSDDDAAEH